MDQEELRSLEKAFDLFIRLTSPYYKGFLLQFEKILENGRELSEFEITKEDFDEMIRDSALRSASGNIERLRKKILRDRRYLS
jgi:hypothetical protein